MSLQYVKPHETKYIPKSVGPDKQLLGQSVNRINQLEDQFYATRTQMDELNHNMLNSMGSLTDEQQNEARGLFEANKQRLDEYVENNGSARASNFARQLASETAREAQPYIQRSGQIENISQTINEAENLDHRVRGALKQNLNIASQASISEQLEFNYDLDVVKNWKGYLDFAKEVDDLMSNRSSRNATQTEDGIRLNEITLSDGTKGILETFGVSGNERASQLVGVALNNSQMREQLKMEAKIIAQNSDDESWQNILDENGNVNESATVTIRDSAGNNHVINALEYMAMDKFTEIGNLMANDSIKVTPNQQTVNDRTVSENDGLIYSLVGMLASDEELDISDMYENSLAKITDMNAHLEDVLKDYSDTYDSMDFTMSNSNELMVNYNGEEMKATDLMDSLISSEDAPSNQINNLDHVIRTFNTSRETIIEHKNRLNFHRTSFINRIRSDEQISRFASHIDIEEGSGNLDVDFGGIATLIEESFSSGNIDMTDVFQEGKSSLHHRYTNMIADLEEGEVKEIYRNRGPNNKKVHLIKYNNEPYVIEDLPFVDGIEGFLEMTNEEVENQINTRNQTIGLNFDTEIHKTPIKNFRNNVTLTDNVTDIEGNLLDNIVQFNPQTIAMGEDGKAIVIGQGADGEGGIPINNVVYRGSYADELAKQMFGDNWQSFIMASSIQKIIPRIPTNGASNRVEYSSDELYSIFGRNAFAGNSIKFETKKIGVGQDRQNFYSAKVNGQTISSTNFNEFIKNLEAQNIYLQEQNL